MPCRRLAIVAGCWFACVALATVRAAEKLKAEPEFFEKLVRPVLADNCFQCHGPSEHKGELRLDSRAAMLQGGEMGPAIVPNNPEASLLITAVHYSDEPKMPPRGKLKPEQIEALSRWIKAGAALGLAVAAQLTYAVPGVALVAVVVAVAISSALRAKQDLAWEKRYSRQYCASKMLDRIRFLPV